MRKFKLFFFGRLFPLTLAAGLVLAAGGAVALWLPRALAPLALAERILSLAVGLYVAASRLSPESKTARLLLLLLLPWTGAVCCLLQRGTPRPEYSPAEGGTALSLCSAADGAQTTAEEVRYFPVGTAFRPAFLADLAAAETFIYLEYYIVAEGAFWSDVLKVLRERAAAGVDVRLIYDDFGCALTLPAHYGRELKKSGIKAFAYGRMRFPWRSVNRRDHRKIAAIDGKIAYTGGINLADEYVGETVRFGHWKDSAVRLTGAAAGALAEIFERTWRAEYPSDPLRAAKKEGGDIPCGVFCDGADGAPRGGARVLMRFFSEARRTLFLQTPYLLPDGPLAETLKTAALAGVDVRVMIPRIPDKKAVFALTRKSARELAEAGVAVREYAAGFLHAKGAVADGKRLYIGSYNLDHRSLRLQAECGVLLEHGQTAREAERDFLSDWEAGLPVPPQTGGERALCLLLHPFLSLI